MPEGRPFPLNAWYAAAWGHEIKHELVARTICEKDVVLYRRADGTVAALEDACRGARERRHRYDLRLP
jgi:phenylpropionate dioxygenase-like ring-hydroxylating dioxygenase large terminal subunit